MALYVALRQGSFSGGGRSRRGSGRRGPGLRRYRQGGHRQEPTITRTTIDPQTKVGTVKGKVRCADAVERAYVEVNVSQVVGRLHTVRGFGWKTLSCKDGGPTPFTSRFSADEGRFAPGEATLRAFTGACIGRGEFESRCDSERLSKEVRLTTS